jgi:hypothetical protein
LKETRIQWGAVVLNWHRLKATFSKGAWREFKKLNTNQKILTALVYYPVIDTGLVISMVLAALILPLTLTIDGVAFVKRLIWKV